jgi:N-acetylated-alpha-linked acidic dipeptidase
LGINVKDVIVIARYGLIYWGDNVESAAQAGAVAVVIYSDPEDYAANYTQGVDLDSQWLPPSCTQRGSVYKGLGDPLTHGWPSTPNAERISLSDPQTTLPTIPSLPISAEDALPILASLSGPISPAEWHGALDLPHYRVGRGPRALNFSFSVSCFLALLLLFNVCEEPVCACASILNLFVHLAAAFPPHHVCAFK